MINLVNKNNFLTLARQEYGILYLHSPLSQSVGEVTGFIILEFHNYVRKYLEQSFIHYSWCFEEQQGERVKNYK